MLCLGFEGTAHTLGVGVVDDAATVLANEIRAVRTESGGSHSRQAANHPADLAPEASQEALAAAKISPREIDVVADSQGPELGPYLRTAATAARAFALAARRPIVGVNHCVAHLELGVRHEEGELTGYAGECIMEECQDGVITEVPVEVVEGTPGILRIRVPMALLIEGGAAPQRTTLFQVASMLDGGSHYWGSYEEGTFGDVHSVFMVDALWGGVPFEFGSGHRGVFAPLAGGRGH
ncbi:MAG: hypothetical protein ACT4PT_11270 [Methanobacteriota archaeon]